MQRSDLKIEAE